LQELSDPKIARGLITFLIAVTTVSIALLLTFFAICANLDGDADEKKIVEANFSKAKEVLTILIGVLGTIVGFYFGQTTGDQKSTDMLTGTLVVSNAKITPDTAKCSDQFTITADISGGKSPYYYTIIFNSDSLDTLRAKLEGQEEIDKKFTVPLVVPQDSTIKAVIRVRDSEGKFVKSETLKVRIKSGSALSKANAPVKGASKPK
jgi:hypothetical protein